MIAMLREPTVDVQNTEMIAMLREPTVDVQNMHLVNTTTPQIRLTA
jgi:hypothetical protein